MESLFVLLLIALVMIMALTLIAAQRARPVDNREPYLRDRSGHVYALIVGPGVDHEEFIHDGTPHQNPAVRSEWAWWLIFPYEGYQRDWRVNTR